MEANQTIPKKILRISSFVVLLTAQVSCAGGGQQPEKPPAVARRVQEGEKFFGSITQLTFGGQNAEAYFSSDGTQLIFQRQVTDETCDQQFTINVDGSDMRKVSNGLGRTTCGYFYDNDERVIYSSTFEHDESCPVPPDMSQGYVWGLFEFDIYTSKPDGSDLRVIFDGPGYDAEATLSRDGSKVVFTSVRNGDLDIYTMNTDGSDVRQLTNAIGYDGGPFFSPDGSKIVYRAWYPEGEEGIAAYQALLADNKVRPSRMEIWVMNADGSNQQRVTDLGKANFAPYFHPDGKRIIFASNHADPSRRGANFDLYMINDDGTNLVQVTRYGGFDGFPQFSADGTKMVFASNRFGEVPGETNIFIADWVEPDTD